MKITRTHMDEQREYQGLCDKARSLGLPTAINGEGETVQGLRDAVANFSLGYDRGASARSRYEASRLA